MKKDYMLFTIVVLIAVLFVSTFSVSAENPNLVCTTAYEVTELKSDGSYNNLLCTDDINEAKTEMNNHNSNEDNVATIFEGETIIDAKYALAYLRTKISASYNTYIYGSFIDAKDGGTDYYTYTNGYYGADAAYLGMDKEGTSRVANIKLSGYTGWVREWESGRLAYEVIPLSRVESATYYTVTESGDLRHWLAKDIKAGTYDWYVTIGPAPTYLAEGGKYYSFDGIYFYTNLVDMIDDYKSESNLRSLNKDEAHYNYYMYLPYRTKTTYTGVELESYITDVKGYNAVPSSYPTASNESMLVGQGPNFITSQNTFGANALLTMALSANESGWGKSSIAVTKNNIFGHGAVDSNPYYGATGYANVKDAIDYHGDIYVSWGYADYDDGRYYGSHFGNKNSGMNVKYASDPHWGEKMAAHYYSVDKALGLNDYKNYEIAIKNTPANVNVRRDPTTDTSIIYQLNNAYTNVTDMPVVVLEEVTGESIDGNNVWYKIQTDPTLGALRQVYPDPDLEGPRPAYNWDLNYGFIHSSVLNNNNYYAQASGKFYYNSLTWNQETNKIDLSGFLVVEGVNNVKSKSASYSLILTNVNTSEEHILPIDRWTDGVPFTVPSEGSNDYTDSWFKDEIDLSDVPEGDYDLSIRARTGGFETTAVLRNIFGNEMINKVTDLEGRGYFFRMNYYESKMPLELFIRDSGLVTDVPAPNSTNMFNTYKDISLETTNLNILGTSHNVGGNYSVDSTIERWLILENNETHNRYTYEIGSIIDGPHDVILIVPDNLSKTRAWYNASVDLTNVEVGNYTIYIRTKSGLVDDYFELNDIFDRDLEEEITIDSKTISLNLNKEKRYRLELIVE